MLTDEQKKEMVDYYLNNPDENVKDIVKRYGVGTSTLYDALHSRGIEGGARKRGPKRVDIPLDEAARRYKHGETMEKIAADYGVSESTLRVRLWEAGVEKQSQSGRPKKSLPIEEVARKNREGSTLLELAEEYGVSNATISRRLKDAGYEVAHHPNNKKPLPVKDIVSRYEKGEHLRQIAEDYPVSHETIRQRLIDAGAEVRSRAAGNYSKD